MRELFLNCNLLGNLITSVTEDHVLTIVKITVCCCCCRILSLIYSAQYKNKII